MGATIDAEVLESARYSLGRFLQRCVQRGSAFTFEQLVQRYPAQVVEAIQAQEFGGKLVGLDHEAAAVNQHCRQWQVFIKRAVFTKRPGNFLLGRVEFLVLDFQLGLVSAQFFDQMIEFIRFDTGEGHLGASSAPGAGALGAFTQFR